MRHFLNRDKFNITESPEQSIGEIHAEKKEIFEQEGGIDFFYHKIDHNQKTIDTFFMRGRHQKINDHYFFQFDFDIL